MEGDGMTVDTEKYDRNKKRLSQAMNGDLDNATTDTIAVLKKYNLDAMPETTYDFMCYVLETIHLEAMNLHEYRQ